MAAATQSSPRLLKATGEEYSFAVRFSNMTSDQVESIVLSSLSTRMPWVGPNDIHMVIVTPPTNRCGLFMACDVSNYTAVIPALDNPNVLGNPAGSLTLNAIRFYTEAGGDITGAVVDVVMTFNAISGGATGLIIDATH